MHASVCTPLFTRACAHRCSRVSVHACARPLIADAPAQTCACHRPKPAHRVSVRALQALTGTRPSLRNDHTREDGAGSVRPLLDSLILEGA
eukprot:2629660-Pleurochrysis_carterae.AAC.2